MPTLVATTISVLIADDHAVWREGLRKVLSTDDSIQVVADATDASSVVALSLELQPRVILLDISLPDGSGMELLSTLRRASPDSRVIMLSVHDRPEYILRSVRNGAAGYLCKDATPDEVCEAVRAVNRGATYFSPQVARHLGTAIRAEEERSSHRMRVELLSPRERDVLRGVADGLTSKEIGLHLGISPRTVETHRESLMRKLEIKTVAGLTRFAIELGLLDRH